MAHIVGVNTPREKRVVILLTYIYGTGTSAVQKILGEANIPADTRVKGLTDDRLGRTRGVVNGYKVEGDLCHETNLNIRRLIGVSLYRGIRHRRGLPVRSQKTKNNARTHKGPIKTVASKRR